MRKLLLSATMLASMFGAAQAGLAPSSVPPTGITGDWARKQIELANPENTPFVGADIVASPYGRTAPPSLEALMSLRPGIDPRSNLKPGRAEELRTAALSYGAAGGMAARALEIDEMLHQREAELDRAFDARLRNLVLPVASGQTLMVPPSVSEEQMAFALSENGRVAHETGRIYRITRQASLASRPPTWRSYLVQVWPNPSPPGDALRPKTDDESQWWAHCVAEGWDRGRKQATEIFENRLGLLESDIIGMERYHILLRAGLVEQPHLSILRAAAKGRGDVVRYGDTVTRIRGNAQLNGGAVRTPQVMPPGPIGAIPGPAQR